jgi:hypothetical protein
MLKLQRIKAHISDSGLFMHFYWKRQELTCGHCTKKNKSFKVIHRNFKGECVVLNLA